MKNFLYTTLLMLPLYAALACDYDGDGIDDPTAIETQANGTWLWRSNLSTGGISSLSSFGNTSAIAKSPGYYFGNTMPAVYGFIGLGPIGIPWEWNVPNGDSLPFGATGNISYMSGGDFNGDGTSDLVKFENRCNKLKRSCYRKKTRGNFYLNNTDGTNTFLPQQAATETSLLGGGLDPIFFADVDADGDTDICFARSRKRAAKTFQAKCWSVPDSANGLAAAVVFKKKIGRIFSTPVSLKRKNSADYIVIHRTRKKKGVTKLRIYPPIGSPIKTKLPLTGKVITGDWIGNGSEQVGVVANGNISYYDPVTNSTGAIAIPAGDPVDCRNNLAGPDELRVANTKNICRVRDC